MWHAVRWHFLFVRLYTDRSLPCVFVRILFRRRNKIHLWNDEHATNVFDPSINNNNINNYTTNDALHCNKIRTKHYPWDIDYSTVHPYTSTRWKLATPFMKPPVECLDPMCSLRRNWPVHSIDRSTSRWVDCSICLDEQWWGGSVTPTYSLGDYASRAHTLSNLPIYRTIRHWNIVQPALRKTLHDLRLGYIDLFLIHWPVVRWLRMTVPSFRVGDIECSNTYAFILSLPVYRHSNTSTLILQWEGGRTKVSSVFPLAIGLTAILKLFGLVKGSQNGLLLVCRYW